MRSAIQVGIILISTAFSLSACGGGGGGGANNSGNNNNLPSTPTNAGGIWEGLTFSDQTGQTYEMIGIVTENNSVARFVNEQGQQFILTGSSGTNGNLASTITAIAPTGYTFIDGSTVSTGTFDGSVVARNSLQGDWSLNTGESGTVTMSYNDVYDRGSALSTMSGTWMDSYSIVYTLDSVGKISAQDGSGCIYSGDIDIIDAAYNAYQVTLELSNCPGANSIYSGVGVLTDLTGMNDAFVVQMDDGQWIFTDMLRRCTGPFC